jgi:hypothetical protein
MDGLGSCLGQHPATAAIVAGEAGFWVFLLVGLLARYPLHLRRFSTVVLLALPVIDLGVLVVTVLDLAGGATANLSHGLAAVYLGFSVVFGKSLVQWTDTRFAYRFAGGPKPPKITGSAKIAKEWRDWGKCVLACVLSAALLLIAILVIHRPEQTGALWDWLPRLGVLTGTWLVFGPIYQHVFGGGSSAVVIELIGILLVVEGAGGLINRFAGGGSPDWFLQLRLMPPDLQVAANAVVLPAGVVVLLGRGARRGRGPQ